MRILLTSSASHVPPRGGSTRSNLAWLEALAAGGHACRVVGGALSTDTPEKLAQVRHELEDQQIELASPENYAVADPVKRAAVLKQQIHEFRPDWVLVSSEDIGQSLLRAAHDAAPGRVVYLAHTPQFYPFGPASWNPDREGAELVANSAAVIAIGNHTADYIHQHLGRRAEVIHPPIYGSGPFAQYGQSDGGFVTIINPCAVKGISIFLALAADLPGSRFAALPGWGTTTEDRHTLESLPNVTLLRNCKNIDQILKDTHILLVPSLWFEGFGLVVVEAMLRGIPVVASDAGGLVEAKLGTNFVIPVRSIERYEAAFDDQGLPRAVLPEPDLAPWSAALRLLLRDRKLYLRESAAVRDAATKFVSALRPSQLEEFLLALAPGRSIIRSEDALERLSPEKRTLLLQRPARHEPVSVSRNVQRLERELGVRLLYRTTRSLSLTDEGRTLYEASRHVLAELEAAREAASDRRDEPAGLVRATTVSALGRLYVVPLLQEFRERYPRVRIELLTVDRIVDMIAEGFDVGIRAGAVPDANIVVRKLADVPRVVCAAPDYLAQHGEPSTPDDLPGHDCINFRLASTGRLMKWEFRHGEEMLALEVRGTLVLNDMQAVGEAAVAGLGLAQLPSFVAMPHIREGRIVPVLVDYAPSPVPFFVHYAARRLQPARIRVFVDFLVERLANHPDLKSEVIRTS